MYYRLFLFWKLEGNNTIAILAIKETKELQSWVGGIIFNLVLKKKFI